MARAFSFAGKTIVGPGILLSSSIGSNNVFALLPQGVVMFAGQSDGGLSFSASATGSVYQFFDYPTAQRVLRSGPLLTAVQQAANAGGATYFVCVPTGVKTPASYAYSNPGGSTYYSSVVTFGGTWLSGDTATFTLTSSGKTATATGATTPSAMATAYAAAINAGTPNTLVKAVAVGVNVTVTSLVAGAPGALAWTGTKTSAGGTITASGTLAATATAGTFTSGDQGTWCNSISISFVTGTTSGFAWSVSYPDALSGQTVTVGGPGTAFDNLTTLSALATLIANNSLLTPNDGISPSIISLAVSTDGTPAVLASTPLSGGTEVAPVFADVQAAVNAVAATAWDIGHLVQIYDAPSQAYADAAAQAQAPYGFLHRYIHQFQVSGASPTQTLAQNSAAVVAAGTARAAAIASTRSSVVGQQIKLLNPYTGLRVFQDAAPTLCGLAAYQGANGAWGPATPLTYVPLPNATAIDYPILSTTGDRDNCVAAGVWGLEQIGTGVNQFVRTIQSVTTAPTSGGQPWDFGEFSVVRVSDALLANVKAAVEASPPVIIGGGNTIKTMQSVLADVQDVLELAIDAQWITTYNPASISITQVASDADIVQYAAAPTRPLNHLGVAQTLLPFQANVTLSATSS